MNSINDDYHVISHNRKERHLRARKNYGGINLLIKKCLEKDYSYDIIDKCYEGILDLNGILLFFLSFFFFLTSMENTSFK